MPAQGEAQAGSGTRCGIAERNAAGGAEMADAAWHCAKAHAGSGDPLRGHWLGAISSKFLKRAQILSDLLWWEQILTGVASLTRKSCNTIFVS